jgi:amino acid permease
MNMELKMQRCGVYSRALNSSHFIMLAIGYILGTSILPPKHTKSITHLGNK